MLPQSGEKSHNVHLVTCTCQTVERCVVLPAGAAAVADFIRALGLSSTAKAQDKTNKQTKKKMLDV